MIEADSEKGPQVQPRWDCRSREHGVWVDVMWLKVQGKAGITSWDWRGNVGWGEWGENTPHGSECVKTLQWRKGYTCEDRIIFRYSRLHKVKRGGGMRWVWRPWQDFGGSLSWCSSFCSSYSGDMGVFKAFPGAHRLRDVMHLIGGDSAPVIPWDWIRLVSMLGVREMFLRGWKKF